MKRLTLFFILGCLTGTLGAQDLDKRTMQKMGVDRLALVKSMPGEKKSIDKFVLTGNTKTRQSAILRIANIELGKKLTDEELAVIIERIKRMFQFNIKNIEFKENTLFLDIEDKWTFFPVPLISSSGKYYSYGIVLYDNNFMGRLSTLALGLSQTNAGLNGILYWQEDNVISKNVGMKVLTLVNNNLTEFYRGGKIKNALETKFRMLILTPNYRHGNHNYAAGPIYISKRVSKKDGSQIFESDRLGLTLRYGYKNFKKLPILFDGIQGTYNISLIPGDGKYDHQQTSKIRFVKPLGEQHFFTSLFHFSYTNNTGHLAHQNVGGDDGHRGYERRSLSPQRNVGIVLQPQIYLWKRWFAGPFYEFNHAKLIKPIENGLEINDSTVGLKLSYYFKKISIPAVALSYSRNLDDETNHFQFSIGLSL